MQLKRLFNASLLALLAITSFSCSKKDAAKTRQELIIGNWQIISEITTPAIFDYNSDGIKDEDPYKFAPDCDKDNYYSFKTGGVLEVNYGSLKCDGDDDQPIQADWALSADGNTIVIDGSTASVTQLDNNTMKLTVYDNYNGTSCTTVTTLVRK
ncbi:MAG: lipocalin family protein [Paludibacteraceae bacterium]